MKTALKIIVAIILVAALGAGIYVISFNNEGIQYDVDSVESIGTTVEIVSEDMDSVTIKKTDGSDFKVVMFSDTHLNGKNEEDLMTVEHLIENITREKPDLVIFGGDNVSSAVSYKRTKEFCQLMENLGVYWATALGNHDGEGIFKYTKKQLAELYSAADVFVNPTWQDNYPTVNLESIACGTPVVTYRTGGSIEAITPATGVVVEQGDVAGLLTAARGMMQRGKSAHTTVCRQHALENFGKQDRYMDYLRLYERLKVNG